MLLRVCQLNRKY